MPHSAIGTQSPYKILHGTEADLRLLYVINAFVRIVTGKAAQGRPVTYNHNSKNYHVYNPTNRPFMKSGNVIVIETPLCLLTTRSEENPSQILRSNTILGDHNNITDDVFPPSLRNYASALEPFADASADHIAVGGVSSNAAMAVDYRSGSEKERQNCWRSVSGGAPL